MRWGGWWVILFGGFEGPAQIVAGGGKGGHVYSIRVGTQVCLLCGLLVVALGVWVLDSGDWIYGGCGCVVGVGLWGGWFRLEVYGV